MMVRGPLCGCARKVSRYWSKKVNSHMAHRSPNVQCVSLSTKSALSPTWMVCCFVVCGPSWNGQRERRSSPKNASSFENVQYTQIYSLFRQMIVSSKGLPNFALVQKNSVYSELTQFSTFSAAISASRLPRTETSSSKINKTASLLS